MSIGFFIFWVAMPVLAFVAGRAYGQKTESQLDAELRAKIAELGRQVTSSMQEKLDEPHN